MAKKIVKTVNRTGKSLVKKALVVNSKKQVTPKVEEIKKLNEEKAEIRPAGLKLVQEKESQKIDKKYNLTIELKDLLNAGCHLGHKISKTHPKVKDFIYTAKDGIQIIDLVRTYELLDKACNYIYNAKRNGKQIVMVGTKRQAREVVRRVAIEAKIPYITDRWLGGMISNWDQVSKSIRKLENLKEKVSGNEFGSMTKKEQAEIKKEVARLEKMVGGLVGMDKLFDIVVVVDAGFEKTAIKEAKIRNLKTVALLDTDSNPHKVDFPIVTNDDNVKSVSLVVEEIGKAIKAAGV